MTADRSKKKTSRAVLLSADNQWSSDNYLALDHTNKESWATQNQMFQQL